MAALTRIVQLEGSYNGHLVKLLRNYHVSQHTTVHSGQVTEEACALQQHTFLAPDHLYLMTYQTPERGDGPKVS